MIWSHGLYDMLTFLLFRLWVISLIFHPPHFFFNFNYFHTPSFKGKKDGLGKANPPAGGAAATSQKLGALKSRWPPSPAEPLLWSPEIRVERNSTPRLS